MNFKNLPCINNAQEIKWKTHIKEMYMNNCYSFLTKCLEIKLYFSKLHKIPFLDTEKRRLIYSYTTFYG